MTSFTRQRVSIEHGRYRMALDHPEIVSKIAVLDVVPTAEVWNTELLLAGHRRIDKCQRINLASLWCSRLVETLSGLTAVIRAYAFAAYAENPKLLKLSSQVSRGLRCQITGSASFILKATANHLNQVHYKHDVSENNRWMISCTARGGISA